MISFLHPLRRASFPLNSYRFSLLKKQGKPQLITLSDEKPIKFDGSHQLYKSIMKESNLKYIPLYISILHKFPYTGVNRAVNYHQYNRAIRLAQHKLQELANMTPKVEEKNEAKVEPEKDGVKIEININLPPEGLRNFILGAFAIAILIFLIGHQSSSFR